MYVCMYVCIYIHIINSTTRHLIFGYISIHTNLLRTYIKVNTFINYIK